MFKYGCSSRHREKPFPRLVEVMSGTSETKGERPAAVVGDLTEIGSLNLNGNPNQCLLQSILGRGEQHLVFDRGIVGRPFLAIGPYSTENLDDSPRVETELVSLPSTALLLELKVIDRPPALCLRKIGNEVVVRGGIGGLFHNDFGFGIVHGEDDVFGLLSKLERLVGGGTVRVDGETRSLQIG